MRERSRFKKEESGGIKWRWNLSVGSGVERLHAKTLTKVGYEVNFNEAQITLGLQSDRAYHPARPLHRLGSVSHFPC